MGCANSKQVAPAEHEPGPVAFAETDEVEEQHTAEPGPVAFAETEVEEQRIAALLDSPNPDVLELRRLTPTQAAAAAEAAARQETRVEKLKAVPHAQRKPKGDDEWTRSGGGAIAQLMEKTPLIDLAWVIDLIELGGTVPRCQDVPNAAVLTTSMVWRLAIAANFSQLPVLVLSYPWLDFWHPDRLGAQLRGLLKLFKAYLKFLRGKHGPHCTVGLMMDFLCLPQKPFTTDAERARFGESLHSINEWYFHPSTCVLVVSTPPPAGAKYTNTRLHEARGWCYFEKCAAMAVKHNDCLWDVAGLAARTNGEDDFVPMMLAMMAKREPPLSPDTMAEDLRGAVASGTRAFTANADVALVIGQYARGFVKAFSNLQTRCPGTSDLFYTDLNWGDEQGRTMLEAMRYVVQHGEFPDGDHDINFMNDNNFSEEMKATFERMNATAEFKGKIRLA